MKKAWSLFTLLEVYAENCDHKSYKELGLVCPICRRELFLKTEYIRKGKVKVASHFSHFSDTEEAKKCELRTKSSKGDKLIEDSIKVLKNQRRQIFREHLWKIITHCDPEIFSFKEAIKEIESRFYTPQDRLRIKNLPKKIKRVLRDNVNNEQDLTEQLRICTDINLDTIRIANSKKNIKDTVSNLAYWRSRKDLLEGIDIERHIRITKEVIKYLIECKDEKLWTRLVKISIKRCDFNIKREELFDDLTLSSGLVNLLVTTNWCKNIEELSLSKKLIITGKDFNRGIGFGS